MVNKSTEIVLYVNFPTISTRIPFPCSLQDKSVLATIYFSPPPFFSFVSSGCSTQNSFITIFRLSFFRSLVRNLYDVKFTTRLFIRIALRINQYHPITRPETRILMKLSIFDDLIQRQDIVRMYDSLQIILQ